MGSQGFAFLMPIGSITADFHQAMLSVPNGMSFGKSNQYIDFTSKGKYDSLYMRIDFEKNTNTGVAFIDFANPEDILNFLTHHSRQWDSLVGYAFIMADRPYIRSWGFLWWLPSRSVFLAFSSADHC